jgi:saccharopine dehydrogenase-like NADP-dependent oxidoreductase
VTRRSVLILGAGKIGGLIACLLSQSGEYDLDLASRRAGVASALIEGLGLTDTTGHSVDAGDGDALEGLITSKPFHAIVSALPYHLNPLVAGLAVKHGVSYFDLTEDLDVTRRIREGRADTPSVLMPQCGLAPGFVNIVANDLMGRFAELDTVKLRVGALPQHASGTLKYALTWSTEGLINEYGNPCEAIERGRACRVLPLEGVEQLILDGVTYEAFNTSGGLGTLAESYEGRVQTMNYKTIRYPGHCQAFRLLLNELKLNGDRATLKRILENAIPRTLQDMVLVYVSASGGQACGFIEESYTARIYPREIAGRTWSAVQVATAAGLCGVLHIVLSRGGDYRGFVSQESIPLADFMATPYGNCYG